MKLRRERGVRKRGPKGRLREEGQGQSGETRERGCGEWRVKQAEMGGGSVGTGRRVRRAWGPGELPRGKRVRRWREQMKVSAWEKSRWMVARA